MQTLQVRAILGKHLDALQPPAAGQALPVPTLDDPNRLVDAAPLADRLRALEEHEGPAAVRRAGRAYVELWGRTFTTLVRHLRARPERALNLFASELYPFLRGDRLAARLEGGQGNRARLVLAAGLPDEYCAGLVEGAVALSGCKATCQPVGNGNFEVRYTIPPAQRLARLVQAVATLRIPLLVAAFLAAAVGAAAAIVAATATATAPALASAGLADAATAALGFAWWRLPLAILAVLAVQGAANAYHDYAAPTPAGPLAPWRPARSWLVAQMALGYGFAAFAGGLLVPAAPSLLVFVPIGFAASLLYHRVRDHGLGPLLVAFTHGPLVALGVLHALIGHVDLGTHALVVLASLPVGALAAAVRTLDDLADRPLDEAGGRRTLAVRLPGRQNALLYGFLVASALATLAFLALAAPVLATLPAADAATWMAALRPGTTPVALLTALALVGAAAILVMRVRRRLDDPNGLAAARAGTIALHIAVAAASVAALGAAA